MKVEKSEKKQWQCTGSRPRGLLKEDLFAPIGSYILPPEENCAVKIRTEVWVVFSFLLFKRTVFRLLLFNRNVPG